MTLDKSRLKELKALIEEGRGAKENTSFRDQVVKLSYYLIVITIICTFVSILLYSPTVGSPTL
jgi:hypothetical protein